MKELIKDVGLCRVNKLGFENCGDDGVLWDPRLRLAMVADGIGSERGNGMQDLERLQSLYKSVSGTRENIRKIFYEGAGEPNKSTIVTLWFPDNLDKRGLLLHAGDSHCVRLRRSHRKKVFDVLTDEHSGWFELKYDASQVVRNIFSKYNDVRSVHDLAPFEDLLELQVDASFLYSLLPPLRRRLHGNPFHMEDLSTLHLFLDRSLQYLRCGLSLAYSAPAKHIREKVGAGKSVSLREGDRFALVTDGIFSDVLRPDEMKEILAQDTSAQEVAENLVCASMEKKLKCDDRGVVVIDL